jgi:hypothetical protein
MNDRGRDISQELRLSAQRALWGAIPPRLRAVSVHHSGHTLLVRSVFDGTPTDKECETLSVAAAEIIADFPAPYTIDEEMLAIPHPGKMEHLRWIVYLRNEVDFQWVYAA